MAESQDTFDSLLRALGMTPVNMTQLLFNLQQDHDVSTPSIVTVTIPAGAVIGTFSHGLGYGFQGGTITASNWPAFVLPPSSGGVDSSLSFQVGLMAAVGFDVTCTIRCF